MKEISIIIATYNAECYLQQCLDSIIPQKGEAIELIIIDGESTDGTINILNRNSDFIDKYISEPDNGIYDAWNKGMKLSTGRWIMFVGADDKIFPNTLLDYAEFASKIPAYIDLITAKSIIVDLSGRRIKKIGDSFIWSKYKKNMNISHGTTLHNRNLFSEYGFFDTQYKICADYEMLMRKGNETKCVFFNKTIMEFKIGGASFSYACQLETFRIRKRYKTVCYLLNIFLFIKRCLGIYCRRKFYNVD